MKIFTLLILLLAAFFVEARKVTVTTSVDNATSPTAGMLRYHISNYQNGDTITFSVDKVNLEESLRITSSVIIDGTDMGMVTLDAGFNDRIFNISLYSFGSKVYLKNLKIVNGKRSSDFGFGGGMYLFIGSGELHADHCIFQNNEANATSDGQGGALRTDGGTFTNCAFLNNKVTGTAGPQGGGGVLAIGGTFINCVIAGNTAKYGGGVFASSGAEFYNCTITGNSCTSTFSAGGIDSEGADFVNCISYGNYLNENTSNITFTTSSFIQYCAFELENPIAGTDGNIGLSSSPFAGGDGPDSLSLVEESSCVNAGTATDVTILETDITGNTRINDGQIDIGAYEFQSIVTGITRNSSNSENLIYPNPSNGVINFKKSPFDNSPFSVLITDLTGKAILSYENVNLGESIILSERGNFQLIITTENQVFFEKVIVK